VVSVLRAAIERITEWALDNDGLIKSIIVLVMAWGCFGAGVYQGRKMAEREALQQLAKLMLEEKAAK
jgi:hypothetical protein